MNNSVKQFTEELEQTAGEIKIDVKDEIGQALEQGVQSVVGTQLTPQQIQQKQIDDQNKIAEARRKINFYQKTAREQAAVRQQNKQKEMQRKQEEQQETEQKKVEEVQIKQAQKKPGISEAVLRSQAELKVGKGVGG